MKLLVLLLVVIAGFVAARYFMPTLGTKVANGITVKEGVSFLADCPDTPNCHCSEASRDNQRVERFPVSKDPSQSIATLARTLEALPGVEVVQFDERYLYATATTSVMQYVDDIEFLLSDDKKSIQVRSASRLGKMDLGANAKRIAAIRVAAEGKL